MVKRHVVRRKKAVSSDDYNRITGKKYTAKQKKQNARAKKWTF